MVLNSSSVNDRVRQAGRQGQEGREKMRQTGTNIRWCLKGLLQDDVYDQTREIAKQVFEHISAPLMGWGLKVQSCVLSSIEIERAVRDILARWI